NRIFSERMSYVSRSGFYTTTDAPRSSSQVLAQFSRDTGSAWFMRQTQRDNPGRGIL
ncbi:cellulose biosynthesis regulator YedQ, partial [Klebsiella aerogenes]